MKLGIGPVASSSGSVVARGRVLEMDQRAAAAERLTAAVRASAVEGDAGARDVEHALAFLGELDVRTLREIERELGRDDSLMTYPTGGSTGSLATFLGRRFAASIATSRYTITTPVPRIRAELLDTLVFREILRAHGGTMFARTVEAVKKALGLPEHGSLAETGFAQYGSANLFLLVDVASAFAVTQFKRTSVILDGVRGPEGMDLYADALDNCHFTTAAFARFLLKSQPSPEKLCKATARGRLDGFGVSPTDIDLERLTSELEKLRPRLPQLAAPYASWGPKGDSGTRVPPLGEDQDDDARLAFKVLNRRKAPRAVGEVHEQRLIRRSPVVRLREHKTLLVAASVVVTVAWYLWLAQATSEAPSLSLGLLAALFGFCASVLFYGLLDAREESFFLTAQGPTGYTVLQGRRDARFLEALRRIAPGSFAASRRGGLPRLFTVMLDREGVSFLGGGWHQRVPVAFHWVRTEDVVEPDNSRVDAASSGHRVAFIVRIGEEKVELSFPLERARVIWAQRNFVENKPIKATLAMVGSLRKSWAVPKPGAERGSGVSDVVERLNLLRTGNLAGTPHEKAVVDWEVSRRGAVQVIGREELRRVHWMLNLALVTVLFGILVVLPVLTAAD